MTADEARASLVETLDLLQRILPATKDRWDGDVLVQLAVERLWITAGNAADEYRRASGMETGAEPWAELVGYRNRLAHALPGDLSSDRIWDDTTADLPRIRRVLRGAQA